MRHPFHAICPYFAMFPEAFAGEHIERLTEPGDVVADPFSGRGTAPFQALLMGRRAVGNDLNEVAYVLTKAKLRAPASLRTLSRLRALKALPVDPQNEIESDGLPEFFRVAFAPKTLEQILHLRKHLDWQNRDDDAMLAAILLGALHGESHKSKRYLSARMPRTISTKPAYSVRYWKKNDLSAPERDVWTILEREVTRRYGQGRPMLRGDALHGDVRTLPQRWPKCRKAKLVLTSPPYFDVTRFEEDQWLRLWFLGRPSHPQYGWKGPDDRHGSASRYFEFMKASWEAIDAVLASKGHVVMRIGATRISDDDLVSKLEASVSSPRRRICLISANVEELRGSQVRTFRPGAEGCRTEIDCLFKAKA